MARRKKYHEQWDFWKLISLFTPILVFYFFWLSLLLGGVFLTIMLIIWTHRAILNVWWYKKLFIYAVLFYISLLGWLYLGWNTLITKVPEINDTFTQWSEEISTYIAIGSNKKWQPILQPNEQWIILETLSNMTITWQIQ